MVFRSWLTPLVAAALAAGCTDNGASLPGPDGGLMDNNDLSGTAIGDGGGDAGGHPDLVPTGPASLQSTVQVPGIPVAMAYNAVSSRLYVSMRDENSVGVGIAVISASTGMMTGIANPLIGGSAVPVVALDIDPSANRVYAGANSGGSGSVFEIDGAANTVTTSIPVPSGVVSLVLDPPAQRLYALGGKSAQVGGMTVTQSVLQAIDTTNRNVATTSTIADITSPGPHALALDPARHYLFVCGGDAVHSAQHSAVDTIDLSKGTMVGAQQTFMGDPLGCFISNGVVTLVTTNPGSIVRLGGTACGMPVAFNADTAARGAGSVIALGHDTAGGQLQYWSPGMPQAGALPLPMGEMNGVFDVATAGALPMVSGVVIWAADSTTGTDAGAVAQHQVTEFLFQLPPPPDGGC